MGASESGSRGPASHGRKQGRFRISASVASPALLRGFRVLGEPESTVEGGGGLEDRRHLSQAPGRVLGSTQGPVPISYNHHFVTAEGQEPSELQPLQGHQGQEGRLCAGG